MTTTADTFRILGEGRSTVQAAMEEGVPSNILGAALFARFAARGQAGFSDRMLSAMRAGFGGHMEKTDEQPTCICDALGAPK